MALLGFAPTESIGWAVLISTKPSSSSSDVMRVERESLPAVTSAFLRLSTRAKLPPIPPSSTRSVPAGKST